MATPPIFRLANETLLHIFTELEPDQPELTPDFYTPRLVARRFRDLLAILAFEYLHITLNAWKVKSEAAVRIAPCIKLLELTVCM